MDLPWAGGTLTLIGEAIELHWKEGVLSVIGVPSGYRCFVQQGDEHIANEISTGGDLSVPLSKGKFLFRARDGKGHNFEFAGTTGLLPVELFLRPVMRYIPAVKKHLEFVTSDYRQIVAVEGLDKFPDGRVHPMIKDKP